MTFTKQLVIFLLFSFILTFRVTLPVYAYDPFNGACTGDAAKSAICTAENKDPVTGKNSIIYKIAMLISYFAGAVGIIMIIYSGFVFTTARDDSAKIAKARQTIVYVAVGLLVIILAAQLVAFIVSKFI